MSNHFAHRAIAEEDDQMHIDEEAVPGSDDDEMDDVQNDGDEGILGRFE